MFSNTDLFADRWSTILMLNQLLKVLKFSSITKVNILLDENFLEMRNYNATIRCLSISVSVRGWGGMNYRWECDAMALNSWLCLIHSLSLPFGDKVR